MANLTTPERRRPPLGDAIAIAGTDIRVDVIEWELAESVSVVGSTPAGQRDPAHDTDEDVRTHLSFRGKAVGDASMIHGNLRAGQSVSLSVTLGIVKMSGNFLVTSARRRGRKGQRFIGVSCSGVFTDEVTEA